ncbi:peptide chain release factor-like protein [Candidatus Carsonella ruddii]|uniref:Peptide chain release factor 2 n=1 Tax=Candidatus Carsonella ruddii (Diaphorina cf. continua) TaxID=2661587 RepID=A0A7R6VYD1_CARRU|nr:peptide chain release factor-like protein [Candidatus Carsonella ruddii (Diaphorina cf. continua)]BCG49358.1 peptide chain release factor 2 [Candidatus Carsonella ruddii (Diaphorina cf. continua)]
MYNLIKKNIYFKNILEKKFIILNELSFNNSYVKKNIIFNNFKNFNRFPCFIDFFPIAGGIDTHQLIKFFTNFYYRWLRKNYFEAEIINFDISNYGFKKSLIYVKNIFSSYLFYNESGIHRIIRKNPLITTNKIQTSYLSINVYPEVQTSNFVINKKDIIVETFKSKGAGGQHVNTTNSAVRIIHKPTNTIVSCQSERSQIKNKNFALKTLEYKILLKNENLLNSFRIFKNCQKYIKTYYFERGYLISHKHEKQYNLNKYFKLEIDFLEL